MTQTIPDVKVDNTWIDLNTALGIDVGTKMQIQNKSPVSVMLYEGTEQPDATSHNGVLLSPKHNSSSVATITKDSLKIWARTSPDSVLAIAYINGQAV